MDIEEYQWIYGNGNEHVGVSVDVWGYLWI